VVFTSWNFAKFYHFETKSPYPLLMCSLHANIQNICMQHVEPLQAHDLGTWLLLSFLMKGECPTPSSLNDDDDNHCSQYQHLHCSQYQHLQYMTITWKQNEAPKPAGERNRFLVQDTTFFSCIDDVTAYKSYIFHAFKKQETKNFSPKLRGCK